MVKEWEFPLLRELVINNAVLTSAQALAFLKREGVDRSRASVIGTLNRWSDDENDDNILCFVEERCQGGIRKVYRAVVNGEQWLERLKKSLDKTYDETYQSLKGTTIEEVN